MNDTSDANVAIVDNDEYGNAVLPLMNRLIQFVLMCDTVRRWPLEVLHMSVFLESKEESILNDGGLCRKMKAIMVDMVVR